MSSNGGTHIPIEKLDGVNNYSTWKFTIRMLLTLEGLWSAVLGEDDDATRNSRALARICLAINPSLYQYVRDATTPKEAWDRLANTFESKSLYRKVLLLRQLHRIDYTQYNGMAEYIEAVMRLVQQLADIGKVIDDSEVAEILLIGLPQEFEVLVSTLETACLTRELTSEIVRARLMQEDHRRSQHADNGNSAYYTKKKKVIVCDYCKRHGHTTKRCYKKKNLEKKKKEEHTLVASAFTASSRPTEFIVDSGATAHMCANPHLVTDCQQQKSTITVANGHLLHSNHIGKVCISAGINLKNVMVVPELSNNLMSVSQIVDQGYVVVFFRDKCIVYDDFKITGNKVLQALKDNGLFRCKIGQVKPALEIEHSKPMSAGQGTVSAHAASQVSCETWHKRLGHLSESGMRQLFGGGKFCMGFLLQNESCVLDSCVACLTGKMNESSYPRASSERAAMPLEVVHTDVAGPMQVGSWGGARYLLTFTDDCTRKTWGYLMKNKSEVSAHFITFKNLVEKQSGLPIKVLRSDNGAEYCNKFFSSYLSKEGIIHQTTVPYCPQQNGVAERVNRTVFEKARAMLFDSGLPIEYWGEAVMTAIYLKNRSPTKALSGGLPEHEWTGSSVDLSGLRVFGCIAYAFVPKQKRQKMDAKAKKYIMVGYGDTCKGYRLSDPSNPRVVIYSRTVSFLENEFLQPNTLAERDRSQFYYIDQSIFNSNNNMYNDNNNINSNTDQISSQHNFNNDSSNDVSVSDAEIRATVPSPLSDIHYCTGDEGDGDDIHDDVESSLPEPSLEGGEMTVSDKFDVSVSRPVRSTRGNIPERYRGYDMTSLMAENASPDDPLTYEEAMASHDKEEWSNAMESEYNSLVKNKVWSLVDRPEGENIVKCKWVFKKKFDTAGKLTKYKARLVARGFSQKEGIDYTDTFSPVVRHSTLRILFSLAIELDLKIDHVDVTTAFLNGELDETIFMEQPLGFKADDKVCLLRKSLYGLKQASRMWNVKIHNVLSQNGYTQSKCEPCIYVKKNDTEYVIIALYVDDFYVFHNGCIDNILKLLKQNFEIRHLGQLQNCLGMKVTRQKDMIILDQSNYIKRLLAKFNMLNCKPVSTPLPVNCKFDKSDNSGIDDDIYKYRQLIGGLMYLSVCTRPDISYACSQLSQYNTCFDISHWRAAKRVLRYLAGTINYGLHFTKSKELTINAYADADWANDLLDRKSYTGLVVKLGQNVINWESRKQRCTALSSTEAEYLAISDVCKDICFAKNFLLEISNKTFNVIVYNDSQSAQKLLNVKEYSHKKTKHIDLRYHFIKDLVQRKCICVKYLPTNDMLADVLTKPLCTQKHLNFVKGLNLRSAL